MIAVSAETQDAILMAKLVKSGTEKGIFRYAPINPDLATQARYISFQIMKTYEAIVREHYYMKIILTNTETAEFVSFKGTIVNYDFYEDSVRVIGDFTLVSKIILNSKGEKMSKLRVKAIFNDKD